MPNGLSKAPWVVRLSAMVKDYRAEVERRRRISKHDSVADTLDYVSDELELAIGELTDPTRLRTAEQYAAEHDVTPATVLRWCRRGELSHRATSRGVLIPPDAVHRPSRGRGGRRVAA